MRGIWEPHRHRVRRTAHTVRCAAAAHRFHQPEPAGTGLRARRAYRLFAVCGACLCGALVRRSTDRRRFLPGQSADGAGAPAGAAEAVCARSGGGGPGRCGGTPGGAVPPAAPAAGGGLPGLPPVFVLPELNPQTAGAGPVSGGGRSARDGAAG